MATQTIIASDISGATDAHTFVFSLEGQSYEIDLTEKEQADFTKSIKKFLDASRQVGRVSSVKAKPKAAKAGRSSARSGPAASEIRAWAQESGFEVPARGRIPEAVVQQYADAHA